MTTAVAMLVILTTGGLSFAFADPRDTSVTPESPSTTGQKTAAEDSPGPSTAAHTVPAPAAPAAAQTPAAAPAKPNPSASDEPKEEKLLRDQGYKPTMRNGEKMFCKREAPMGSRLQTALHCVTVAEAEMMAREGRQTIERIQRTTPGCLAGAHGPVCGN